MNHVVRQEINETVSINSNLSVNLRVKSDAVRLAYLQEHIVVQHGEVRVKQAAPNDCVTITRRRL